MHARTRVCVCVCIKILTPQPSRVDVTEGQFAHIGVLLVTATFGAEIWRLEVWVAVVHALSDFHSHVQVSVKIQQCMGWVYGRGNKRNMLIRRLGLDDRAGFDL